MFPECEQYHLRFQLLESTASFPLSEDFDLHLFQLRHFTKTADELETDLDLWLYLLNNAKGLNLRNLPRKLKVPEIEEAMEAWTMLTQDQIRLCEELLRCEARPQTELEAMSIDGLQQLAEQLRAELVRGRSGDSRL